MTKITSLTVMDDSAMLVDRTTWTRNKTIALVCPSISYCQRGSGRTRNGSTFQVPSKAAAMSRQKELACLGGRKSITAPHCPRCVCFASIPETLILICTSSSETCNTLAFSKVEGFVQVEERKFKPPFHFDVHFVQMTEFLRDLRLNPSTEHAGLLEAAPSFLNLSEFHPAMPRLYPTPLQHTFPK